MVGCINSVYKCFFSASDSEKRHMVFGRPRLLQPLFQYCLLHQLDFVSAYSQALFMPLWTSFTLSKPADLDPLPEVIENCLRADVRIAPDGSPSCDQYAVARNVTLAFLYPPNLNSVAEGQYDGLLMSNVVPMYPGFKSKVTPSDVIWCNITYQSSVPHLFSLSVTNSIICTSSKTNCNKIKANNKYFPLPFKYHLAKK
nr:ectonucleotide pyrophosphatase/phosphodiesterase family member 3-like [Paramormyrops kingsleyae]